MSHDSCDMRHWTRTKGNGSESISSARNWARTFRVSLAILLSWEASLWGHRDQLKHRDTVEPKCKLVVSVGHLALSCNLYIWTIDRWTYGLVGYLVFLSKVLIQNVHYFLNRTALIVVGRLFSKYSFQNINPPMRLNSVYVMDFVRSRAWT